MTSLEGKWWTGFPDRQGRQALGRTGIENRLAARYDRLKLVVLFPPRHDEIPAQAEIESQIASRPPAVLAEESLVPVAHIEGLARRLREVAGNADQEIRKGDAGFASIDIESAVEGGVGMLVYLVGVKLTAELDGVRANHFRDGVAQIKRVVVLAHVSDRHAHHEGGEGDVHDAFKLGRLHGDALRPRAGQKSLRREGDAEAAFGLADHVGIAKQTDAKFVHGIHAENLRVAETE